jgi:hypothetical protein
MSHDVVMQLLGVTTTRGGADGQSQTGQEQYPTKVRVTTEEMVSVNL